MLVANTSLARPINRARKVLSYVQVMRRLRSALVGIAESIDDAERVQALERYVGQLDLVIMRSPLDDQDSAVARQQDRQGLGASRRRTTTKTV